MFSCLAGSGFPRMMAGREVNRLRMDIHLWHQRVIAAAPTLAKHITGTEFDDPGILDTFSDQVGDLVAMGTVLGIILGRTASLEELAEWTHSYNSLRRTSVS